MDAASAAANSAVFPLCRLALQLKPHKWGQNKLPENRVNPHFLKFVLTPFVLFQAARRRTRASAEAMSRDWTGFLRISVTPAARARSESIGPV